MTRFQKGMKFRSLRDLQVRGIVAYGGPYSGFDSTGFDATFPAGEILVCGAQAGPRGMWLVPERYEHFEQLFVPDEDRRSPEYGGYAIGCLFNQIGKDYELFDEKAVGLTGCKSQAKLPP